MSLPLNDSGLPRPGREMDRWIAENIFGRDPMNARHGLSPDGDIQYYWGYPIGHAYALKYSSSHRFFQVMHKTGWWWTFTEYNDCLVVVARTDSRPPQEDWSNIVRVQVDWAEHMRREAAYAHAVCACAWKALSDA